MGSTFSKVESAQVSQSTPWFEPGRYKVRIEAVKVVTSAKSGHDFVVIECEVIESSHPDLRKGMKASQRIDMDQLMGPPNFKQFLCAASGVDGSADDVNAQLAAAWREPLGRTARVDEISEVVCGTDNPLADTVLDLVCTAVPTKTGGTFTKHSWQVTP